LLGLAVTVGTYVAALVAMLASPALGQLLAWPSLLLGMLIPARNLGTAAEPIYEGTPLHMLAGLLGIPLAWFLYSIIVHIIRKRRPSRAGA
jgi:hypothetical protein